ncbi:LuxR family transcriptional regulator [Rhodobacterales bacterium HKCCE3408]|nr:LuxR family transcriptional regulator [Rhodobacterales bacterium HKCCE3408]
MAAISAERIFARIAAAEHPTDLWRLALKTLPRLGFPRIIYRYAGLPTDEAGARSLLAWGLPDEWIESYLSERLGEVDPSDDILEGRALPFYWYDMDTLTTLSTAQSEYMARFRAGPMGDGLTLPLFGPIGRNAVLYLGFGGPRRSLSDADMAQIHAMAQAGHLRLCAMMEAGHRLEPRLTPREREVLTWIAAGKSNSVIAEILGISAHTVDTILRRVFNKFGVSDRTTAAIRGIALGLVPVNRFGTEMQRAADRQSRFAAR